MNLLIQRPYMMKLDKTEKMDVPMKNSRFYNPVQKQIV